MKKYIINITSIFGLIGALSWGCTNLLRMTPLNNIETLKFILGIMPNISACWFFIWVGEIIYFYKNNNFTFKVASFVSFVVFLLAIVSEIIHDRFLNSPFDVNDMIATIVAIVLYLVSFYMVKNKSESNE